MKLNGASKPIGKALLSSRFRYAGHRLLFGRARLYQDRIVFSGLTWTGYFRRTVLLCDVDLIQWWPGDPHEINFVLTLQEEEAIKGWIAGGGLWKYQVEEKLGKRIDIRAELPGLITSSAA